MKNPNNELMHLFFQQEIRTQAQFAEFMAVVVAMAIASFFLFGIAFVVLSALVA